MALDVRIRVSTQITVEIRSAAVDEKIVISCPGNMCRMSNIYRHVSNCYIIVVRCSTGIEPEV